MLSPSPVDTGKTATSPSPSSPRRHRQDWVFYFYFGFLSRADDETLARLRRCCHVSLTIFTGYIVRSTRSQAHCVTSYETKLHWDTILSHSAAMLEHPFDVMAQVTMPPPLSRQRWQFPVSTRSLVHGGRVCPMHEVHSAPQFAEVFGRCGGIDTGGINTMYRSGSKCT
ncbi:hypothetical protein EDB89DRAFT_1986567 [Lactarius sanguifluus]|nr:hypothetical protein EDB89DRAFT_1986567 [Lactarius sanguifluus]